MGKRRKGSSDARQILHRRFVGDDAARQASLEAERVNARVARLIYDVRTARQLTQSQLAELIETTQSVVSRLEDADYEGHSLSMLKRIAQALNLELRVTMTPRERGRRVG